MATRSVIVIPTPEDTENPWTGIYCHWDGYPAGVGATLRQHYTDDEKVAALIKLGSISALGPLVEPPPVDPDAGTPPHAFDTPVKGVTIAYHRDRDEPLMHFRAKTLLELDKAARASGCEYRYTRDPEDPTGWRERDLAHLSL
jgi:hypothetical protein